MLAVTTLGGHSRVLSATDSHQTRRSHPWGTASVVMGQVGPAGPSWDWLVTWSESVLRPLAEKWLPPYISRRAIFFRKSRPQFCLTITVQLDYH